LLYEPPVFQDVHNAERQVIIIGCGPAGLFAALTLLEHGIKPIIYERGKEVSERKKDIALLNRNEGLNPESNYCFGEGGAGTFSDGKLFSRSKKRGNMQRVMELFHFFGAPDTVLYEAHAHIGSDKLPTIIKRMREFAPPGTPVVFTGDHNCRETEAPAIAISEILTNALYASKTVPEGPWRTADGWMWVDKEFPAADALKLPLKDRNTDAISGGHRIDYIYVSKGVEVLEHKTHADPRPGTKLYPSDHFPVTARIILPG
jgi:hypothetical protein